MPLSYSGLDIVEVTMKSPEREDVLHTSQSVLGLSREHFCKCVQRRTAKLCVTSVIKKYYLHVRDFVHIYALQGQVVMLILFLLYFVYYRCREIEFSFPSLLFLHLHTILHQRFSHVQTRGVVTNTS
jgi:hypothetical protein